MEKMLSISLQPQKFYAYIDIIKSLDDTKNLHVIEQFNKAYAEKLHALDKSVELFSSLSNQIKYEILNSTKVNRFESLEKQFESADAFDHTLKSLNFIQLMSLITSELLNNKNNILNILNGFRPMPVMVSSNRINLLNLSAQDMQNFSYEVNLNSDSIQSLIITSGKLFNLSNSLNDSLSYIDKIMNIYSLSLKERHDNHGIKIFENPIITDIAMSIYENIDSHGEIQRGKKEISAYTIRQAELLLAGIQNELSHDIITGNISVIQLIHNLYSLMIKDAGDVVKNFRTYAVNVKKNTDPYDYTQLRFDVRKLENKLADLALVNPYTFEASGFDKVLSAEEKQNLDFKNDTIKNIVELLIQKAPSIDIITYVFDRKKQLKKEFETDNSFYVCKMGGGNSFLGEAPGQLTVVPGARPDENIDNILGSGFNEVREFVSQLEASSKWEDLFLATSPSKTVDKSNVLLIGPPGTGKTSVMKAVATSKDNISIYSQGSDFLTCWKGEADKNPKRLFEEAVKLQRNTNKPVNILIDEIDSVLKKQEFKTYGETDLSLEFQTLMDGIVFYSKIRVWGTTNNPERIPLAMIRRFSKVLIVGKLSLEDRVNLLKLFIEYLPTKNFTEKEWELCAAKLEGATGDVIRKVADYLWRDKMTAFVKKNKEKATEMIDSLNKDKKFNIKEFDDKERFNFKQALSNHVNVTPEDLQKTIKIHLTNVAINAEIEEAVKSYEKADKFLNSLNNLI